MGQDQILGKLNSELQQEITEESQVVFILSKIRKYLELKNLKDKYKYLNFYCNWALHTAIDKTEHVADILEEFIKLSDKGMKFITFQHFLNELKNFLIENNLPTNLIDNQRFNFINLLVDIYSETPVRVYSKEIFEITIRKPEEMPENANFSVAFSIKRLSPTT